MLFLCPCGLQLVVCWCVSAFLFLLVSSFVVFLLPWLVSPVHLFLLLVCCSHRLLFFHFWGFLSVVYGCCSQPSAGWFPVVVCFYVGPCCCFFLLFFPLALPTEFCIICFFFRFLVLLSDLVVSSSAGWSLLLLFWLGLDCFGAWPVRVVVVPFRPPSSSEFSEVESNSSRAVSSSVDVIMLASLGSLKGSVVSAHIVIPMHADRVPP